MASIVERKFYTVGHSSRSWPEFLSTLRSAAITAIVDVRRFPASRRYPHFSKDELRAALDSANIEYQHIPGLGGYRGSDGQQGKISPNDGFAPGFLRNYADYALTDEFRAAFEHLGLILTSNSAIMCAEKDWRDCHRQIISDYAIAHGYSVFHVLGDHEIEAASLTPGALIDNRKITYRKTSAQLQLF